ncbi:hypothetical protein HYFRA_00007806 [Hymenoscyphus fraxineus]|uniref:Uncharacterized protein n=1 Tax=Hymenoscyphus fraxineus TaxID=746836 RepID=A0A9N9KMT6_9HELO|nr:hypothetical protein HYFRA_00007806 [Hymenoscyphus fraxineus]
METFVDIRGILLDRRLVEQTLRICEFSRDMSRGFAGLSPFLEWCLDSSTEFLFGRYIDILASGTPSVTDDFMKAFDRLLLGLALLLFVDKRVEGVIEKKGRGEKEDSGPKNMLYVLSDKMAALTQDL